MTLTWLKQKLFHFYVNKSCKATVIVAARIISVKRFPELNLLIKKIHMAKKCECNRPYCCAK